MFPKDDIPEKLKPAAGFTNGLLISIAFFAIVIAAVLL